jgi:hypothetical protein
VPLRLLSAATLPAREVDGLKAGLDHLHRLIARHCAQRSDIGLGLKKVPKPIGADVGERMVDSKRSAQPQHVVGSIRPIDSGKTSFRGGWDQIVERQHWFFP